MEIHTSTNRGNRPSLAEMRTQSSNSIKVHHEVTVVSSTDNFGTRNAIYSSHSHNAPPVATHIRRPSNRRAYTYGNGDDPRIMTRYSRPSRNLRYGTGPSIPNQMQKEGAMADGDRESMRTLAEFLMKIPPPPTNIMARGPNDEAKSMRRHTFSILGKMGTKKKKEKPEKLIQLPDSAVSCQTDTGARYIAITIPIEQSNLARSSHHSPMRDERDSRNWEPQSPGRAEWTSRSILDPVVEMRESRSFPCLSSSSRSGTGDRADDERGRSRRHEELGAQVVGPEAAITSDIFYPQQNRDLEPDQMLSIDSGNSRNSRSYVAFPIEARQDSHHELRNSSAAAESTATPGHSRGVSSVSTAPSLRGVHVLPRSSSLSMIPSTLQEELAELSAQQAEEAQKSPDPNLTWTLSNETMHTGASISPPVISTAKTAQSYGGGLVEVKKIRDSPKPRSPAPSTIIDLSGDRALVISRPATAPPHQARLIKTDIQKRPLTPGQSNLSTVPTIANAGEHADIKLTKPAPKSRQERVKDRKSRDMALFYIENTKRHRKSAPGIQDYLNSGVDLTTFNPRDFNKENKTPVRSKLDRVNRLNSIASTDLGDTAQDYKELAQQMILQPRLNRQNMLATHRDKIVKKDLGSKDEIQDFTEVPIQPSPRVSEQSRMRRRNANISIDSTSTARFLMDNVEEKQFDEIGGRDGDFVEPTVPLAISSPSQAEPKNAITMLIKDSVGESTNNKTHEGRNFKMDSVASASKTFKILGENSSHESLSKMTQRKPKHHRPTSRDSPYNQDVSEYTVIAPRDSSSGFANSPPRTPPTRQVKPQHGIPRRRPDIALSPIRTVAVLPAYTGYLHDADLPYKPPAANTSSIRRSAQADKTTQTPTSRNSSITSSLPPSDSDNLNSHPRTIPKHKSVENILASSAFEQMRFDRRAKRNRTLKEKASCTMELEKRLSKVERDNLILVRALSGIAGSVKGLESFYLRGDSIEEEVL